MVPFLVKDDAASIVTRFLAPTCMTHARATCRQAMSALTHSAWAQVYWRQWCLQGKNSAPTDDPACWFAAFVADGPAHAYMCSVRRERLLAALHARGLELRSDSWLCASFIAGGRRRNGNSNGNSNGSGDAAPLRLADVVDGMETMDFLFRRTAYADHREQLVAGMWEDAIEMATDAAAAASSTCRTPASRYHSRMRSRCTANATRGDPCVSS